MEKKIKIGKGHTHIYTVDEQNIIQSSRGQMKLQAVPITLREANDFVEQFHRHNGRTARDGGKWAIGVCCGEELLGVAIVGNPLSATLMDGFTAEVLRVCVREHAPKGANSFLYSRCWRIWQMMGGTKLITYTLATESGSSLKGAGWKVVGQTQPHDAWKRKKDNCQRQWQPLYGQLKLRWEKAEPPNKSLERTAEDVWR